MVTATTEPVRLPPGPRIPKAIQGLWFLRAYHEMYGALSRRYGSVFRVNMPRLGHALVVCDPVLVKEVLNTSTDLLERATTGTASLGDGFGSGSTFSLAGDELLERRKLVLPQFHGKRMRSYEPIIEEEVMREIATWPEGREFETLPSMTTMALGAILRPCSAQREPRWMNCTTSPAHGRDRRRLPGAAFELAARPRSVEPRGPVHAVPAPFRRCDRLAHRRCAGRSRSGGAQRCACTAGAGALRKR